MRSAAAVPLGVVALLAILGGCQQAPPPPATTTTTLPAPPAYPKTTHVTLFQFPDPQHKGECGVVALPYHAWVAEDANLVWEVVDDYCKSSQKYEINFQDPNAGDADTGTLNDKKKKGKFKGKARDTQYKYTVKIGNFVHDPEFEIWP